MHPGNYDRTSDNAIFAGGRREPDPHPGADQSRPGTGHGRIAEEQELIMPNDVRFHDRRCAKAKPVLPPFEFIALLRQELIRTAPEGPSSVRESPAHGSAQEA